jgi:hypothetical protein
MLLCLRFLILIQMFLLVSNIYGIVNVQSYVFGCIIDFSNMRCCVFVHDLEDDRDGSTKMLAQDMPH